MPGPRRSIRISASRQSAPRRSASSCSDRPRPWSGRATKSGLLGAYALSPAFPWFESYRRRARTSSRGASRKRCLSKDGHGRRPGTPPSFETQAVALRAQGLLLRIRSGEFRLIDFMESIYQLPPRPEARAPRRRCPSPQRDSCCRPSWSESELSRRAPWWFHR
jgi:hypothetical protein